MTKAKQIQGTDSEVRLRAISAALTIAVVLVTAFGGLLLATQPAQAQTYSVLYSFWGKHGKLPSTSLVRDKAGSLFGTTYLGGDYGLGVVFKLKTTGKEKVLHSFTGGADGEYPYGALILDKAGNLYGSALEGGVCCGTIFKLDTTGTLTTLYSFTYGTDGAYPYAGLIFDKAGNLYGTASSGGVYGFGTIFKLDTTGTLTTLYSFTGGVDGGTPYAGVIFDKAGNLYGTASGQGIDACTNGCGTVFELDTTGAFTVLYSFAGYPDGGEPFGGLILDKAGNLYGTTYSAPWGTIFEIDTTGTLTTLYSFTGGGDGGSPMGGVVRDKTGNLYGTTYQRGNGVCRRGEGCGTVFKLDTTGTLTTLYSFTGGADGGNPYAGLILDGTGNLYGTARWGGELSHCWGYGCGTVFKLTP